MENAEKQWKIVIRMKVELATGIFEFSTMEKQVLLNIDKLFTCKLHIPFEKLSSAKDNKFYSYKINFHKQLSTDFRTNISKMCSCECF